MQSANTCQSALLLCSHPSLSSTILSLPSTHPHASCHLPRLWTPRSATQSSVTAPSLRSALWTMLLSVCDHASARTLLSRQALRILLVCTCQRPSTLRRPAVTSCIACKAVGTTSCAMAGNTTQAVNQLCARAANSFSVVPEILLLNVTEG